MNYPRELTWLRRTIVKSVTTGQDVETFTANGTLWGSLKELSASKRLAYGVTNSAVDTEVHLRQFPSVDAKDRLQDTRFGYLLVIDGVTHDFERNETIVYATRLPSLEA